MKGDEFLTNWLEQAREAIVIRHILTPDGWKTGPVHAATENSRIRRPGKVPRASDDDICLFHQLQQAREDFGPGPVRIEPIDGGQPCWATAELALQRVLVDGSHRRVKT